MYEVQLENLPRMLLERNIQITLDVSDKELLAQEGYEPPFVARPLKRAIQQMIQNPLAVKLLKGEIAPGQTIRVSSDGDKLAFTPDGAVATAAV